MATRADIVAEARSWVGTPFYHQGRAKGLRVDCAGLIVEVGRALGFNVPRQTNYGRFPMPQWLKPVLEEYFDRVAAEDVKPGDFFYSRDFLIGGAPRHFGFFTADRTIIHADMRRGKCVEHALTPEERRFLLSYHRFRGVID